MHLCNRHCSSCPASSVLSARLTAIAALTLLAATLISPSPLAAKTHLGAAIPDFALRTSQGGQQALSELSGRFVVVAFLGVECPLAKLYGPRLEQLHQHYSSRDVSFLGVNSNAQDTMQELQGYVRTHELTFPVTKDPGNRVADLFHAQRTPEVFVLDEQRRVRYRGRIDDQYGVGYARERPTQHDLREALDQLLDGEAPATPETVAVGCHIGRVPTPQPDAEVTYSSHIAGIMNKHCVECHRDGEIAPFTLTQYDDVAAWSETIAEVIHDERMPPWHADPGHGEFSNSRGMTREEKRLVYRWAESGAPLGNEDEIPPLRQFPDVSWRMGQEPDQIVPMRSRPFRVPAQGIVEYQYFVADPGFTEDRWIKAAEIVPGNRTVVHHAIVFIRAPEAVRQRGVGWLTAYVPGQSVMQMAPGQARRVPAGSKFIFQMHYTAAGSPQEDLTQVGFVFADDEQVEEEVVTLAAINNDFEIPPFAADFPVPASLEKVPPNGRLLAVAPHMHVRGRSFQVTYSQRGEPARTILNVPRYDFNWQHAYRLAEPLPLKDARIHCVGTFDNSDGNLVNPDPSATVYWGDQTWQEMMIAFFEVALPRGSTAAWDGPRPLSPAERRQAKESVDRIMERWDANGDGAVTKQETTDANAFLVFAFNKMDANRDGKISRDEATEYAKRKQLERRRRTR